jgi:hypothetical protein
MLRRLRIEGAKIETEPTSARPATALATGLVHEQLPFAADFVVADFGG